MAEPHDEEGADFAELLEGWGTPEPRPAFVERVMAHLDAPEPPSSVPTRSRWMFTFAVGGLVGALTVGLLARGQWHSTAPARLERMTHLQIPGVIEVVGEPGARLHYKWRSAAFEVEVVEGIAWLRAGDEIDVFVMTDGDETLLRSECARVEVLRSLLSVDVAADQVTCDDVRAAIDRAGAELLAPGSR